MRQPTNVISKAAQYLFGWQGGNEVLVPAHDLVRSNTDPLTGGNNIVAGTSTLKLPAGESSFGSSEYEGITLQRHFSEYDGSVFATGRTVLSQHPATAPFYGVRLMFQNSDTAAAMNISGVKIASSPTLGAVNDGAALTWMQVTFSGSNTVSIPAATGTVNDIVPKVVFSDYIPIASVARSDVVGANPLLFARVYFADSTGRAFVPAGWTNANAVAIFAGAGNDNASAQQAGDYVTTTTARLMNDASMVTSVAGIEFYQGIKTRRVSMFGDSLFSGVQAGYLAGWHIRAQNLFKAAGRSVTFANYAKGGQTLAASYATAKNVMTAAVPKVAVFYAFSPNSGAGSQAALDAQWAACLDMIRWCKERNITPVVCTSGPVSTYSGASKLLLQAHNARTRASLAGVCQVLDFERVLQDPADPLSLLPAYTIEGTHYTDAGYQALANYVYASGVF